MRVLILSAFLVCAAAAPSHTGWTFAVEGPIIPIAPTLSPGDIQAASIDAQVAAENAKILAEDQARAALDIAKEKVVEQGTENLSAKAISNEDLIKENNAEATWSLEEKKWQALDAIKTAEAQIDGKLASVAPILAKSAVSGVPAPYIAAIAPGIATAPFVYSAAGYVAPGLQTISTQSLVQKLDDSVQVEAEKSEAAVKTAAPEAEKPAEKSAEAEKIESAEKVESAPAVKAVAEQAPVVGLVDARFPFLSLVPYSPVALAQPAVAYSSAIQHGPFVASSIVQNAW